MLRNPEMRINILSCKWTGGIPAFGRKLRKKRDGTKILGLYTGHLKTFFQSFLPTGNASNHEKEAISRGDKVTQDPKPAFQKWIRGRAFSRRRF